MQQETDDEDVNVKDDGEREGRMNGRVGGRKQILIQAVTMSSK